MSRRTLHHLAWIGIVLVQGLLGDSTEPAPGQLLDPLDERVTSPSTTLVPRLPISPAPPPHEALPPRPPLPPMEPIRPEPEPLDDEP